MLNEGTIVETGLMLMFMFGFLGLLESLLEFLSFGDLFLKNRVIHVLKCSN